MMNGRISFPMANDPLVGRPALNVNLRNWILIFLYNQLYTQVHISFPSFPMLSLCGTNYQTLCITVRLSFHSSTVYVLYTSGCLLYMYTFVSLFPQIFLTTSIRAKAKRILGLLYRQYYNHVEGHVPLYLTCQTTPGIQLCSYTEGQEEP